MKLNRSIWRIGGAILLIVVIIIALNGKLLFDMFLPDSVLKPFYGFFGIPTP